MPGGAPGAGAPHVAPSGTTLGGAMHIVFCKTALPGAVQWRYSAGEPPRLQPAPCLGVPHLLSNVPVGPRSGSDPVIWAGALTLRPALCAQFSPRESARLPLT